MAHTRLRGSRRGNGRHANAAPAPRRPAMISRRNVLGVLIASGCLGWRKGARAAGYPDAPVRLVLPYTAGSDDVQARLVAHTLGHYLGQPIVVEAHAGAGGNIAAHYTAHASAD